MPWEKNTYDGVSEESLTLRAHVLCDDDVCLEVLFANACAAYTSSPDLTTPDRAELLTSAVNDVLENGVPPHLPYERFMCNGGAITDAQKQKAEALQAHAAFVAKARAIFKPSANTFQ